MIESIIPYIHSNVINKFDQETVLNRQLRIAPRFYWVWLLMGVASFLSGNVDAQQPQKSIEHEPSPANPIEPSNQSFGSPDRELINEILAIRQQLGGGVAEHLHGLKIGETDDGKRLSADQVFNQELDRIASQLPQPADHSSSGRPASSRPNTIPGGMARNPQLDRLTKQASPQTPAKTAAFTFESTAALGRLSTATLQLRRAARQLEAVAAELEEVKLFQEADDLRDRARTFWRKARETDSHSP